MDKLLTKYYKHEQMTENEIGTVTLFLSELTPMQRHAVMLCYRLSPREAGRQLGIDAYDFLTNLGILEVE